MSDKSKIEWTESTWNPTTGCSKVSPGCAHCYAETLSLRYGWSKAPWTPEHAAENVVLHPDRLEQPLKWKTPRRVFVDSMSDLFHDEIPFEYIDRVFAVMALTPQHTYQVLTKRPERMREYMADRDVWLKVKNGARDFLDVVRAGFPPMWPPPNVWLGVTVENQHWADIRIPILLDTPAAVRFLSCEPLLGAIDIAGIEGHPLGCEGLYGCEPKIDWVICGGESGQGHRPFDPDWARDLYDQCEGIAPFFMKQMGGHRPGNKLEDLPPDLRVREFP